MAVKVRIPSPLQKLTQNQAEVMCEAKDINEVLADLEKKHAGIRERLCDGEGKLRRFVNVYVNEEDIRFLQGQETALKDGDDISIIPAIAGGAPVSKKKLPKKNAPSKKIKTQITLVFPQTQIKEPAVFLMAQKFDLMPNIRRARVTETVGEMTLEVEGTEANLIKGIKYLESRGIKVESLAGGSAL